MSNNQLIQRLTPFEHYMLADDRAAHPMQFYVRLGFRGLPDRERLERSFAETLRSFPLFSSVVQRVRGRPLWNYMPSVTPRLTAHTVGKLPFAESGRAIQISRESGLRASFAIGEQASELWLQVHHSCCDAIGLVGFVTDWFGRYRKPQCNCDAGTNGQERRGIEALAQRLIRPKQSSWRYLAPSRNELGRLARFTLNRPWPIRVPDSSDSLPAEVVAFVSRRIPFSVAIWREIKSRLSVPASFNDVLLGIAFRVLCDWNDEVAGPRRRYRVRLAMPMDLRAATGQLSIGMNNVSIVFMDQKSDAIRGDHLLRDVHHETSWIKRHQGAFVLHDVLRTLQPIPGAIESLVAPTNCTTTMVVSNLGHFDATNPIEQAMCLGDAQLSEIDFLAPIRRGTLAALGVLTYLGELHLCLHYDARRMPRVMAEELLSRITNGLQQTMKKPLPLKV